MTDKIIQLLSSECLLSFNVGIELAYLVSVQDRYEVVKQVNNNIRKSKMPETGCGFAYLEQKVQRIDRLNILFKQWIKETL